MDNDRFRSVYKELSEKQKLTIAEIKALASELEAWFEDCRDLRCRNLATTKLEESIMWAIKGIT